MGDDWTLGDGLFLFRDVGISSSELSGAIKSSMSSISPHHYVRYIEVQVCSLTICSRESCFCSLVQSKVIVRLLKISLLTLSCRPCCVTGQLFEYLLVLFLIIKLSIVDLFLRLHKSIVKTPFPSHLSMSGNLPFAKDY